MSMFVVIIICPPILICWSNRWDATPRELMATPQKLNEQKVEFMVEKIKLDKERR
jgi:hypothetical protein